MINSYAITKTGNLTDRYRLASGLPKGVKPQTNTKPAENLPVIVAEDGANQVRLMKWGFFTQGAKNSNSVFRYKTYSVKSEDVFKKSMFSTVIRSQRCLVPVNGFYYDVSTSTGKKTHYVHMLDDKLFTLAGVYSSWQDPDGKDWNTFSIITTTGNKDMRTIDKRMPVILPHEVEADWLDPSKDDMSSLYDMMRPYPPNHLIIEEVKNR